MRASRLLSILIQLQLHGQMRAAALAEAFEVSVRTIYRDIDALSAAGVPVFAERGRNGGIALLDGYRTRLTGLTRAEAQTLLLAGGTVAADLGLGTEAAAAQLKLLASLSADFSAGAERVGRRFHLDAGSWYASAACPVILPKLARAVWEERQIRVRYESWKGVVARDLDPLGLVLKAGIWYLVAAWRERPLSYRVDNIQELSVLETPASRPAQFDLSVYWQEWTKDFEARLLEGRAVIEVSPEGRKMLRAFLPAVARRVDAADPAPGRGGWIRAEVEVEETQQAARQFLSLGSELRVIGPPALRAAIISEAERVSALYAAPPARRRSSKRPEKWRE